MVSKKAKIFQWCIVALILINVIVVIVLIIKPYTQGPSGPHKVMVEELNFNEEQLKQYDELAKKHHELVRKNRMQMRGTKNKLFNSSDKELSAEELDSLTTVIGNLEKELDILTYKHFRNVYKICDDEQKEKFGSLVNHALNKGHNKAPKGKRRRPQH